MASINKNFNKYPRFIIGESYGEELDEFIVHTRYPRFMARIVFEEHYSGRLEIIPKGEVGIFDGESQFSYKNKLGVWFRDIILFDKYTHDNPPEPMVIQAACDAAVAELLLLDNERI